ncbi:fibronectin type III domain-containing protein [Spirosoma montaniterrae]|uniref:Fibronectin type-III domain-containing protein n=1 Tax=Spirosoma montaniterrae TaxID=1178516 RepID=A0A1P9WU51_9BACT|nr:fibronectin type III domain-containing protein [Spirosoma montaniterrae]AQG78889.1 hypothetical protein AWR27_05845 [Spirosoma montaniterrae]
MKRITFFALWLSLLLACTLGLQNCKKAPDPAPTKPPVATTPGTSTTATATTIPSLTAVTVTGISSTSARVSAVINGNGGAEITYHGFAYYVDNIANAKQVELGATSGPFPLTFTAPLTNLLPNTTYTVVGRADNAKGSQQTIVKFTTTAAVVSAVADWKSVFTIADGFNQLDVSIDTDGNGNVYVVGSYEGAGKMGSATLTAQRGRDGFLAKIDPLGKPIWVTELKSIGPDYVSIVDIDAAGNIYTNVFAGNTGGKFGTMSLSRSGSSFAKVTPDGSVEWIRTPGRNEDAVTSIDGQGSIYVSGALRGNQSVTLGSVTLRSTDTNPVDNTFDSFIAKFDRDGTFQWARQFSGPGQQSILYDVDENGAVYLAVASGAGAATVGTTTLSSAGEYLLKLSASGEMEWNKFVGNVPSNGGVGNLMVIRCTAPNEFVAQARAPAGTSGFSFGGATTTGANSAIVAVFGQDGTPKWALATRPSSVFDLDKAGNLYMAAMGSRGSPFTIGDITLPAQSPENKEYWGVAKYSTTQRRWLWAVRNRSVSTLYLPDRPALTISATGVPTMGFVCSKGSTQFGQTTVDITGTYGLVLATIEQK